MASSYDTIDISILYLVCPILYGKKKKLCISAWCFPVFREKNLTHTCVSRSNWSRSCHWHDRETVFLSPSTPANLSFTVLQWTSGEFVGACFPLLPRSIAYAIPARHRFVVGQEREGELEFLPRSENVPWTIRPWTLFFFKKKVSCRKKIFPKKCTLILQLVGKRPCGLSTIHDSRKTILSNVDRKYCPILY